MKRAFSRLSFGVDITLPPGSQALKGREITALKKQIGQVPQGILRVSQDVLVIVLTVDDLISNQFLKLYTL